MADARLIFENAVKYTAAHAGSFDAFHDAAQAKLQSPVFDTDSVIKAAADKRNGAKERSGGTTKWKEITSLMDSSGLDSGGEWQQRVAASLGFRAVIVMTMMIMILLWLSACTR